ncbi:hypothetical protein D3C87_1721680 [compost metagenome]
MRSECCFNLSWFDTETADLDLIVDAADEVDNTVVTPFGKVACAVHTRTGWSEWTGDEAFSRELRAI